MLGTNKPSSICRKALCVHWECALILRQEAYHPAFTFCLGRASGPTRGRTYSIFRSLLECAGPQAHGQSCACTWPSRFPGIYCTISKSLWTSYSSAFPFNFLKWVLSRWLFALTVITASGNYSVKQWLLMVLIKAWGKSCLSWASPESSQIKTNPGSGISQGGIRTNYDKSLGMGFEGTPISFCLF